MKIWFAQAESPDSLHPGGLFKFVLTNEGGCCTIYAAPEVEGRGDQYEAQVIRQPEVVDQLDRCTLTEDGDDLILTGISRQYVSEVNLTGDAALNTWRLRSPVTAMA